MTGPIDSVIGIDIDAALHRFLTNMPGRLPVGKGRVILNAILLEVDETSGKTTHILRLERGDGITPQ
jgi:hypothetical protein